MKKSTAIIEENVCFENFYAGIGHDDASPMVVNNVCYANIRAVPPTINLGQYQRRPEEASEPDRA